MGVKELQIRLIVTSRYLLCLSQCVWFSPVAQRPSNAKGAKGVKHLQSNAHIQRREALARVIQTILFLFTELSSINSSKDRSAPVKNSEARELR
jgi:hypothetical protein